MISFRAPPSVTNVYNPNGSVRTFFEFVASIGHMNEFQLAIVFSRIIVKSDGRAIGTMTRQRNRQFEQPSTRAA